VDYTGGSPTRRHDVSGARRAECRVSWKITSPPKTSWPFENGVDK
jgi:hypothetical protein